jgi:hypothetical protein
VEDRGLAVLAAPAAGRAQSLLVGGARVLHVDGDLRASRAWFDAAYRVAERDCDGSAMAMAALGLGGLRVDEHRSVAASVLVQTRLRRALAEVDPQSSLALRLRARLASGTDYRTGGHAAILALVEEARRARDPIAWAETVSQAHQCLLGPDHGALRHILAEELISEGYRTARRSDLLMGMMWRTVDLILDADPHAERCLAELRCLLAVENHLAVGFVVQAIDVMLSIRAGRFEQAETQAAECAEHGRAVGDADADGWFGGHMVAIRWYQGRIAELLPMLRELVNSPTLSAVDNSFVAALAVAAATAGDHRQAAGALARVRGSGLERLPRSSSWLVTMCGIVQSAYLLDDVQTAAAAYDLLRPFARLPMVASLGVACFGSVHHALGVASLTTRDADRAVEHLRAAVHDNLAIGHWPAVALSRSRLAQALSRRAAPRDTAEAERELDIAMQEAAGLGMALSVEAGRSVTSRARRDARPRLVVCRRHGRQWWIELGGRGALVEHSRGMSHLATLLANPGYEIPAVELAAGPGPLNPVAAEGAASSIQPVLDDVARCEYRQRLSELQAEIDEYESSNDIDRATKVRAERAWLVAELAAATGLSGRVRQFANSEERARIAVGKAIRRALGRITAADPAIGDELRATIATGLRCCYRPH